MPGVTRPAAAVVAEWCVEAGRGDAGSRCLMDAAAAAGVEPVPPPGAAARTAAAWVLAMAAVASTGVA